MGASRFLLALLSMLFLLQCASAWTISGDLADSMLGTGTTVGMVVVIGVGTIIGMSLAALSYYAAAISNDERARMAAIGEIKSTLINVVICAFVIGAIVAIEGFFNVMAGQSGSTMVSETASMYRANIDYLLPKANEMAGIYSDATQVAGSSMSVSTYIDLPWGFKVTLNAGRASTFPILERVADALQQAISTIISIAGQQAMMVNMMRYFVMVSCQLLLPFGFFLRAIPYVRRAGSTLVAIGISLVLIYPIALFFFGNVLLGIQASSIISIFGGDFNPAGMNALAANLELAATAMRALKIGYSVVGDLMVFNNIYVQGAAAFVAMVLVPVFGIGQGLAALLKAIFLIANIVMSLGATGYGFEVYNIIITLMDNYFLTGGGMDDAISLEYATALFGTVVNMAHVFIMAGVILSVVGGIRALAILLGGEFFLYGVQEYI